MGVIENEQHAKVTIHHCRIKVRAQNCMPRAWHQLHVVTSTNADHAQQKNGLEQSIVGRHLVEHLPVQRGVSDRIETRQYRSQMTVICLDEFVQSHIGMRVGDENVIAKSK